MQKVKQKTKNDNPLPVVLRKYFEMPISEYAGHIKKMDSPDSVRSYTMLDAIAVMYVGKAKAGDFEILKYIIDLMY